MKESRSLDLVRSLFIAAGILLVCCLAVNAIALVFRAFPSKGDESWKQKTTPLPEETVNDLCLNLSITQSSLCDGNQDVYAQDFYPRIIEVFAKKTTTYQDVQLKLGRYQVELEPLSKGEDGKPYFVAEYDLRGDGETWIAFFFTGTYEENRYLKVFHHFLNEGL